LSKLFDKLIRKDVSCFPIRVLILSNVLVEKIPAIL
jgi:hypothetical protein